MNLPSLSSASEASLTESRPWQSLWMLSERSATHLTGRPVLRAAQDTSASSGNTPPFMPKPPPTSGEITRNFISGSRNTAPARPARTLCGCWVEVCSVVLPLVGSYSAAQRGPPSNWQTAGC